MDADGPGAGDPHRPGSRTPRAGATVPELRERLLAAEPEVVGRFENASNVTLLLWMREPGVPTLDAIAGELGRSPRVSELDGSRLAVYKPVRGETPLWDFPEGTLHRREVAAYEVSRSLGWDLVPCTVLRGDGPLGPGSVQAFVEHDPRHHYFALAESGSPRVLDDLRRMVVFDLVVDNADRKAGHVLLACGGSRDGELDGRVVLVDHGVTFNVDPKLRTVAWDFADDPLDALLRDEVARLAEQVGSTLGTRLAGLLSDDEIVRLAERARQVAELRRFPRPRGPHPYPWPPL